jgi:four helix bundle protein
MEAGQSEKGARRFEELWVWQQARELVKEIYEDFRSGPGSKDFGFRNQLQTAGISVMNNIAEGFERSTDVEFARFLDIARGSCGEVRSMYYAAEDLGYVNSELAEARRSKARQISAGIASLASHLRK